MEKEKTFSLSVLPWYSKSWVNCICVQNVCLMWMTFTRQQLYTESVLISLNTHMEWKGFPWTWTHLTGGKNNKHAVKNSLIWTSLALQSINVNSKECCHSLEFIILSLIISGKLRLNPKSFKPATPEGFDTFIPMMGVAFAWSLLHF